MDYEHHSTKHGIRPEAWEIRDSPAVVLACLLSFLIGPYSVFIILPLGNEEPSLHCFFSAFITLCCSCLLFWKKLLLLLITYFVLFFCKISKKLFPYLFSLVLVACLPLNFGAKKELSVFTFLFLIITS